MSCGYNINGIKNLFITDSSYVAMRDESADVSSAIAVDTKSIEFDGSSELDNTYTFGKKLTVTVNGLSVPLLSGKRFIIEDKGGNYFLLDEEFDSSLTWRFTLDKNDEITVWDIEIPSNLQIKPCDVSSVDRSALSVCEYDSTFKPYMITSPKAATLLNMNGTYLAEQKDRLDGEVVLTVAWDGVKYDNRVQITLPLNGDNVEYSDMIQRFVLYRHTFAVRSSLGWYVGGYEHGAEVQVDIATDSSTKSNGSLTLTFTEISDSPCMFFSSLSFSSGEDLFYDYVKFAHDGTKGYICSGDGQALYILQRGYYQDGTATKLYKAKSGYTNRFPNLELTGVFYSTKIFINPECFSSNVLSTTLPGNIKFNSTGRNVHGTIYSENSEWEITNKPYWVVVTPDHGDVGNTNVTISTSYSGSETYLSGSVIFTNGTMTQVITVSLNKCRVIPDPATHDASGFTVKLRGSQGHPATLVNSPQGITTKQYSTDPPKWKAAIPSNNTTSDRTFTWEFLTGGVTTYETVTQSGCFEQWKPTGGYICDNGDSYEKEVRLISYYGSSWTPTGETRKGDLLEQDAPYCAI